MGLSQHFTIGGLLRRTQRQYPRIYIFTKFSIIFTMVGTTSLLLISGSSLPFQGAVKSWIGHRYEQCKLELNKFAIFGIFRQE